MSVNFECELRGMWMCPVSQVSDRGSEEITINVNRVYDNHSQNSNSSSGEC
jgi:hypothetical protein